MCNHGICFLDQGYHVTPGPLDAMDYGDDLDLLIHAMFSITS